MHVNQMPKQISNVFSTIIHELNHQQRHILIKKMNNIQLINQERSNNQSKVKKLAINFQDITKYVRSQGQILDM